MNDNKFRLSVDFNEEDEHSPLFLKYFNDLESATHHISMILIMMDPTSLTLTYVREYPKSPKRYVVDKHSTKARGDIEE